MIPREIDSKCDSAEKKLKNVTTLAGMKIKKLEIRVMTMQIANAMKKAII
jgi:hypothetical protein